MVGGYAGRDGPLPNRDLAVPRGLGNRFNVKSLARVILNAAHHHQRHVASLSVSLDFGDNVLGAERSLARPRLELDESLVRIEAVELDLGVNEGEDKNLVGCLAGGRRPCHRPWS